MSAKIMTGLYLLILGICIGGIIVLGFTESTILNADALLRLNEYASSITKYDQGIILSDVVAKFGYIVIFAAIFILFYDTLSYRFQKSNFFVWILSILNTILMFLFGFFYAPKIVNVFAQEPKIMASPDSESLLNSAEIILQVLLVTLLIAFFIRITLLDKSNKRNQ
ncbi:hypothetical protein CQA53_09310 [Helicobacter didelphidarum]|uniref:DUF4149 domain-containing protein n=1 Tax=Helicobacter didelphidarum TaxID=2040648 RepID=A0A3D8IBG7_9HELI|nr:hypothetical protein [Helicobacter didelphidarum]RDU62482.1 hypothetical protein CQA53_09310 [Helicobacter didelphidarum]